MRRNRQNHVENTELLEMLNEEIEEMLLQMCGNYAGLPTVRGRTAPPHSASYCFSWDCIPLRNGAMVSIGIGKMVVEFFSAATSTNVCR